MYKCVSIIYLLYSEWAKQIPRSFAVRFNPYTRSIQVLDNKESLQKLTSEIKYDIGILQEAVSKI